ncbi:hypothetical protein [Kluyvera sichuanensis]
MTLISIIWRSTLMPLLEMFLTASPASQGETLLFLAMLIYWQKR